jgi:intracellular sulfur oxidation DsrE/DsrF family protein
VLDEKENKIGVPIKASLIYNNPGLKFLEQKFVQNESIKERYKQRVKVAIDWALLRKSNVSMKELTDALSKEQIRVVLRCSREGYLYGITYVDLKTGCVFNGSDLGKEYSANGLLERCAIQNERSVMQKTQLSEAIDDDQVEQFLKTCSKVFKKPLMKPEMNQNAKKCK